MAYTTTPERDPRKQHPDTPDLLDDVFMTLYADDRRALQYLIDDYRVHEDEDVTAAQVLRNLLHAEMLRKRCEFNLGELKDLVADL